MSHIKIGNLASKESVYCVVEEVTIYINYIQGADKVN